MRCVHWVFTLFFFLLLGKVCAQDCRPQNDSMVLVDFFGATNGGSWKVRWNLNRPFKDWHGISVNQAGCVTAILLSDNNLQGNIPDLNLPFLVKLDVSDNNMLSTLPAFSKVQKLQHLNISKNRFHGSLPALKNSAGMEVLIANHNRLDGSLPDYSHMTEIQILNLANNALSGTVSFLSMMDQLSYLNLRNNNFHGNLPILHNKSNLTEIDVSQNQFSGPLPVIDRLGQMTKANFSENKLTGSFTWPKEVSVLQELNISHNRLSDTLPATGPIGKLEKFYASGNRFSGPIPHLDLPHLRELLLDGNQLTGSIPVFDDLPVLEQFSLRKNELEDVDFTHEYLNQIIFSDISENRLTFQDVVPFRNFRGGTIVLFPQKNFNFLFDSFTVTKGNNYTIKLDTDEDHFNTEYRWFQNGERINQHLNKEYFISNTIPQDAGTYTVTMTNSTFPGVSIMSDTFTLVVNCPQVIEERQIKLCPGEIFTYKGRTYDADTTFADSVFSQNEFVCDSLYLFTVETFQPDTVHAMSELCEGEVYYFGPDSLELTQSGSYLDTFTNLGGCDSIVRLDLRFRPVYHETRDVGLCPGEEFHYEDSVYHTDVDLVDSFSSIYGCDSIVTLQVRFSDPVRTTTRYDLCSGDSILLNGQYFSTSTSWTDTLSARGGCDSIATVQVVVHDQYEKTINVELCSPDTYEWQDRKLSSSGRYSDTLQTIFGCDSIVHLNLTIAPSYFSRDTIYMCPGDSVFFNTGWLTGPGIYFSERTSVSGCDSVNVLEIMLQEYAEKELVLDRCMGDTVRINEKSYTRSGMYTDTLFSETSCDTLITIDLSFTELVLMDSTIVGTGTTDSTGSITVEAGGGQAPYRYAWNTGDTTALLDSVAAGDYTLTITDSLGCSAIFELTVPVMTFVWQSVEKKSWIKVRPNFVDRSSRTSVYLDVQEGMRGSTISLYNEMGQEVSKKSFDVLESGHSMIWELGSYPAGVYYFHIREEGTSAFQVERLVVL